MFRLLLLFIVLPAAELGLLLQIGRYVGVLPTLGLIVLTGAIGAALARSQGLRVIGEVRGELEAGRLPAGSLVDGLLILLAAAVLVTPGILTDVFGFLCLTPSVRSRIKQQILARFERAVAEGRIHVGVSPTGFEPPGYQRPMKDVTPKRGEE